MRLFRIARVTFIREVRLQEVKINIQPKKNNVQHVFYKISLIAITGPR